MREIWAEVYPPPTAADPTLAGAPPEPPVRPCNCSRGVWGRVDGLGGLSRTTPLRGMKGRWGNEWASRGGEGGRERAGTFSENHPGDNPGARKWLL